MTTGEKPETESELCLCVQAAISQRLPDSEDRQPADCQAP